MRTRTRRTWAAVLCLVLTLCAATVASAIPQDKAAASSSGAVAKTAVAPSAGEIAAAKASGKVWVNLESGIYHKGGRWYGKTKNGKFMSADEAKKAGYKAAKRN